VWLSSNDSWDIVLSGGLKALEYKNNNVLIDLNEFVSPQTMPNYFKWVTPDLVFSSNHYGTGKSGGSDQVSRACLARVPGKTRRRCRPCGPCE